MKPLIDVLDEMNLKEDKAHSMVVEKLERLSKLIFSIDSWRNTDLEFVNDLMESIIEKPALRITKSQIEKCNRLFTQYKEQVK